MVEEFFGSFDKKDKGNIFCVSRLRAPLMAMAFDALSFPLLSESVTFDDLNNVDKSNFDPVSLNISVIHKSFVNIKKFCQPFPSCVAY